VTEDQPTSSRPIPRFRLWIAGALWIALIAGGFTILNVHAATPGAQFSGELELSDLPRSNRQEPEWTAVLFAHPHCPCTDASLNELADTLDNAMVPVRRIIVCVEPPNAPAGWSDSELFATAKQRGFQVLLDRNATLATKAGAATSGLTILLDPSGKPHFSGGVTASRGHRGPNSGTAAILRQLTDPSVTQSATAPVYGCPLTNLTQPNPTRPPLLCCGPNGAE
jgi:hypothetical protein